MAGSSFAHTKAPGTIAPIRPLDHANSMAMDTGRFRVPRWDAGEVAQRTPRSGGGGSLAGHGTGERDKQAIRFRTALGTFL